MKAVNNLWGKYRFYNFSYKIIFIMKTLRFIGITLLVILLCLSSCSSGEELEPEPEIQVPAINDWYVGDKIALEEETKEISFSFTANFSWSINVTSSSGEGDWCTVTPISGSAGYHNIKLQVTKNETFDNRIAQVALICKNEKKILRVEQKGRSKPEKIQVEKAGNLGEYLNKINSEIESLIIEGDINGDDIASLREFYQKSYNLKSLDLLNVNIVKGGGFEYKQNLGVIGTEWRKETCDEDKVIPDNMFNNGFRGLEELILPSNAISIGKNAFEECVSLKQIQLPTNTTHIGSGAFRNCVDLENINLPGTIISIGSAAFWQCNSLKSISIPDGVTKIASNTFNQCRNIASISLPESLTEIEPMAFANCSWGLKKIIIPKNVKKIGYQAFYECDKLNNVTCLAETAPEISHRLSDNSLIYAFDENYRGYLSIPKFCSSSYRFSDWNKFFTIVEMNE